MSDHVQSSSPSSYQTACSVSSSAPRSHQSELPSSQSFIHRQMICQMMVTAEQHQRDFVDDSIRLIIIYFTRRTNNIDKVLYELADSDTQKQAFQTMVQIYDIRSKSNHNEPHPTLARIAEALPHVSLVMCDSIAHRPQSYLKPWVSNHELGAIVNRHFKMNYFPGLIDMQVGGLKAEAGLLLANLCFAKVLIKTNQGRMTPIQAFFVSCRFAANMMAQQLAPAASRKKFTEFAETLPLNANIMNEVWKAVLDGMRVLGGDLCLTPFHEQVYKAQPLDLAKWHQLLGGIES